jgi:hypothetical protein
MRWLRNAVCSGDMRSGYSILVGNPEGKRPFGKPRLSGEENIGMDLREIEWGIVECMLLTLVNTAMNVRVS